MRNGSRNGPVETSCVAIVEFDGLERDSYALVPLTTVHQPAEAFGALSRLIDGGEVRSDHTGADSGREKIVRRADIKIRQRAGETAID